MKNYANDPEKLFYLVNAQDATQRNAWYYVMVRPESLAAFRLKLATKNLVLTDYGTVVESGYGNHPPAAKTVFERYLQKAC